MNATDDTPLESGPAPDYRTIRRQNKLRRELIESRRLESIERSARVRESWQTDWVPAYLSMLTDTRGETSAWGPSSLWQRKHGQNYPVFRTEAELSLLRFPSRWLCATNGYAIGFKNGLAGYVLGTGCTYRITARPDAENTDDLVKSVQAVVAEILEANEWFGGEQPGLEDEFFDRTIEDGEAIVIAYPPDAAGITQFRFAEAEQLTQPPATTPEEWSFGIRVHPDDVQTPLGYWIRWSENAADGQEFAANVVTHFRRNAKRTIKRGVPEFAFSTFDAFDHAAKLLDNMGDASVQRESIVATMQFDTGTRSEIQAVHTSGSDYYVPDEYGGAPQAVRKSRKGTWEYLPGSQNYIAGPAASNATAHVSVLQSILRAVATRWNAPEWLTSSDASNSAYASSLTAESQFVKRILREQRRYCSTYRRMIWRAVEQYANTRGGIGGRPWSDIVALVDLAVEAPNPTSRNNVEDAQVAAIEIPLGVQSPQAYMQSKGRDAKQIEADNAEWSANHAADPTGADQDAFMQGDEVPVINSGMTA